MAALPAAARAMSTAVTDGVAAARGQDATAFDEATARLAALDPALVAEVLGALVRSLLEHSHPDGLTGDDLRTLLAEGSRAASWASGVDLAALAVVLTGALGLNDPEEQPAVGPASVARHAVLLVAQLLGATAPGVHLEAAFAELARAQTIELP